MVSRRAFVQQSLTALVGSSVLLQKGSNCAGQTTAESEHLKAIGLQLYTVRSEMQKSVEATLDRVAQIGYNEVEFAGYFGRTPQQISDALKKSGLTSPAAHIDMRAPWDKTLEDAAIVGHEYLVVPWMDESQRTPDGVKQLAQEFNRRGEAARKAGKNFAYHNHDFEFKPLGNSGKLLYDTLLESTDPKLVQMEMDLFWVTHGGADPLTYWKRYPGRFPMLHIKDMAADRSMQDVGSGQIPFAKYFKDRDLAGAKHFFVEHDEPKEPFVSIAHSYAYLKQLSF
jgi:sugar phosphate isomerase/epimerase